jgi:hypothetical protein
MGMDRSASKTFITSWSRSSIRLVLIEIGFFISYCIIL